MNLNSVIKSCNEILLGSNGVERTFLADHKGRSSA